MLILQETTYSASDLMNHVNRGHCSILFQMLVYFLLFLYILLLLQNGKHLHLPHLKTTQTTSRQPRGRTNSAKNTNAVNR